MKLCRAVATLRKGLLCKAEVTSLTENAKKLSEEELYLLEFAIFNPLDFYEILFDRIKSRGEEKCSEAST